MSSPTIPPCQLLTNRPIPALANTISSFAFSELVAAGSFVSSSAIRASNASLLVTSTEAM